VTWVVPVPGWVCPECGFDYDGVAPPSTAETVRGFGRRYQAPLTRGLPGEDLLAVLRARPAPEVWSALEYACHVRDAMRLYHHRIDRALAEDRPAVKAMGRDAVVTELDYNGQDPPVVAAELAEAAAALADRLASVPADGWARCVVRDGSELSVDWMARNAVHEGSHHLLDVGRSLREARGR
jgi:DinB superfamily